MGKPKAGNTTRQTIAKAVAEGRLWSERVIASVLDHLIDEIMLGLEHDGVVSLHKFGVWEVKAKAQSNFARNFHTGEWVTVKARNVLTFRGAPKLYAALGTRHRNVRSRRNKIDGEFGLLPNGAEPGS